LVDKDVDYHVFGSMLFGKLDDTFGAGEFRTFQLVVVDKGSEVLVERSQADGDEGVQFGS
jgi:hypothetical protein